MIDRISSSKPIAAVAFATKQTDEAATAKLGQNDKSGGATSLPHLINLVRTLADSGPPIDSAKVARVRQAIAEGNYHVDVEALANAMLTHMGRAKE